MPVKASSIYSQPTLKNLEKKFEENEIKRQPFKQKLKTAIDWVLSKSPASLKEFTDALLKEKIQTVQRQNNEGLVYGITFIDYRSKSIFNGSDLGKQYSIGGIRQKLNGNSGVPIHEKKSAENTTRFQQPKDKAPQPEKELPNHSTKEDLLQQLTTSEKAFNKLPFELLKKKKRKRNHN